jgi:hypothetical protein
LSWLIPARKVAYSDAFSFVCARSAHTLAANIPVIFRTYDGRDEPAAKCAICEAARATSATPTFFKRIKIGPSQCAEPFVDGGLGRNPLDVVKAMITIATDCEATNQEMEKRFRRHKGLDSISGSTSTRDCRKSGWMSRSDWQRCRGTPAII